MHASKSGFKFKKRGEYVKSLTSLFRRKPDYCRRASQMSDAEASYSESASSDFTSSTQTEHTTRRLLACYLLVSHSPNPTSKNRTYIGFTVDPCRRLRQHNGIIQTGGARRTSKHRPWQMLCLIHGFTSKTQALQFEWAWQHPNRSIPLKTHFDRPDALPLPSRRRTSPNGCVQTLAALVSVPPWSLCPLTLTVCAERPVWDAYKIDCVVFPTPFRVTFAPLQSFVGGDTYSFRHPIDTVMPKWSSPDCKRVCLVCTKPTLGRNEGGQRRLTHCSHCGIIFHLVCLATCRDEKDYVRPDSLLPNFVRCPECQGNMHWSLAVRLSRALDSDDD